MSKTSRQPQPKDLPEGTLAYKLSKQEADRNRAKFKRRAKVVGAVAAAATLVGLGAHKINEMDKAHKQDVAEEAAEKAIAERRVTSIDTNTNIYLRDGVTVRTEPKIVRATGEDRGNELLKVGKGKVLVISNPVNLQNEYGEGFIAFTLDDGRTGYVAEEVLDQEDPEGNRYAIVAPENSQHSPKT